MSEFLAPIPPGEILYDALKDARLSIGGAARALGIPMYRLNQILEGKRPITLGLAVRLGRLFKTSAQMWLNLQAKYDREKAES
jgi:addiction module HigA family antidote